MKKKYITYYSVVLASVFLLFGCEEVDVPNYDDPSLANILKSADDFPTVLSGAYAAWWQGLHMDSPYTTLSVAADHGSSSWGNFNMREVGTVSVPYGLGDHSALNNTQSAPYTAYLEEPWYKLYSSISTANDVLNGINNEGRMVSGSVNITERTKAQALFIRGLDYGYLGLLFDQAFVVTENTDVLKIVADDLVPYAEIIDQAIMDLEAAVSIMESLGNQMKITQFNGVELDGAQSLALANTYIAKFLAQKARTAAETLTVDWAKVKAAAEKGIDFDLAPKGDGGANWEHAFQRHANAIWTRVDQRIVNMVDSTHPYPFPESGSYTYDIATMPDKRFGDKDSKKPFVAAGSPAFRPDRGVYFFCYFKFNEHNDYRSDLSLPMVTLSEAENDLLLAEAIIRTAGDLAVAAGLINKTRVANGGLAAALATDADLLDKVFYERYIDAWEGPGSPFFDRRRTDDLGKKQFLHFPIPASELNTLRISLYTFGGE
ncbi:MAG: RagB/SusD family nutrient uptake outer membrane protein [Flavobacteriaceae bacterium]|nr:RagB/SusD family nutrient uptake outer membrane protein [Flavobacteriaceae bacterium]